MSTLTKAFRENKWLTFGSLLLIVLVAVVFFPKISLERRLYYTALQEANFKQWELAIQDFERVVRYSPESQIGIEAARKGGEIALYQQKDFNRAIFFFRHVVRKSSVSTEAKWAQKMIADIYYEKLNSYQQAVVELHRLLQSGPPKSEAWEIRYKIAKAYFYMANFDQAIAEADTLRTDYADDPKVFDALVIKGNALLALKKSEEAIKVYREAIQMRPNLKENYQLYLNMSIAYEEMSDFEKAIEQLNLIRDYYPHSDVIDLKIKSILRRKEKKKEE